VRAGSVGIRRAPGGARRRVRTAGNQRRAPGGRLAGVPGRTPRAIPRQPTGRSHRAVHDATPEGRTRWTIRNGGPRGHFGTAVREGAGVSGPERRIGRLGCVDCSGRPVGRGEWTARTGRPTSRQAVGGGRQARHGNRLAAGKRAEHADRTAEQVSRACEPAGRRWRAKQTSRPTGARGLSRQAVGGDGRAARARRRRGRMG
jgi:hypothetical protein